MIKKLLFRTPSKQIHTLPQIHFEITLDKEEKNVRRKQRQKQTAYNEIVEEVKLRKVQLNAMDRSVRRLYEPLHGDPAQQLEECRNI